ncbi:hypothetical protein CF326_g8400, partial [Tilletia indica]
EIEAVLAHELGHWAHRDPTKLLVLAQGTVLFNFSLFSFFIQNRSIYSAFGFQVDPTSSSFINKAASVLLNNGAKNIASAPYLPVIVGLELFQLVLGPADALVKFIMNSSIRRMEFAADRFAAELERPKLSKEELESSAKAAASLSAASAPASSKVEGGSGEDAVTKAGDNSAAKDDKKETSESVSARALVKAIELDDSEKEDPDCKTPYAKLLGQALIRLHVENLSTIYYDSLYSAWNHSHPTLMERLNALQPFVLKAEKAQ